MRVLKYAILGLLDHGSLSGYDMTSRFKAELGQFWSAKHSQIYPELKKLTDEGFIEYETVIQGSKLEKKMYSITEAGKRELHGWLTEFKPVPDTVKDEFMLKAYFISSMEPDEAKRLFADQLQKRQEKAAFLKTKLEELKREAGESITFRSPHFGHYLVLTRALEREIGYCSWLEKALPLMENDQS
ncbi:PadR family transcriptional regulator [Bacillus haynesii]|uniref:PadR family transcriptional regulator n=1 Tax=Bacillus haynesii TaxID=1925021 RepID=UPI00227DD662|nr:PadR family transcriptional regulator [Bacillus haynesii]MCY7771280.1 PadR family transcriptional regulator [Bacillus haynesii]MCY8005228.1 PadR family transcriptional regulator [Bacillus haynesii]MCY8010959.1 PadR family transcriptional regulator [Bacillus haynesii]MCY9290881.1 PadR family transcriptional regulator [Bacillus haynesii]MEC0761052.1 PadR family transcriptional regulator [Bacillus haynesii]